MKTKIKNVTSSSFLLFFFFVCFKLLDFITKIGQDYYKCHLSPLHINLFTKYRYQTFKKLWIPENWNNYQRMKIDNTNDKNTLVQSQSCKICHSDHEDLLFFLNFIPILPFLSPILTNPLRQTSFPDYVFQYDRNWLQKLKVH